MISRGFIFQGDAERDRIIDLAVRLRWAFTAAVGLLTVAMLLAVPAHGPLILAPLAVSLAVFVVVVLRLPRFRRPELAIVASWAVSLVTCSASIALADGAAEHLFLLPAIANLAPALVFRRAVVLAGAACTGAAVTAVALLSAGDRVADAPAALVMPVLMMLACSNVLVAARDAELFSRESAGVDPLTGVFNRTALDRHGAELELRAARHRARIGVIVGDIDHFKAVNDEHGHARGDAVLKAFAARLRAVAGAEASVYRFGGEEFVVVLAQTDPASALGVAQRLVEAVRARPLDGLGVTASFGVAVSADGGTAAVGELFAVADTALYEAKVAGRDRVVAASPAVSRQQLAAAGATGDRAVRAPGDRRRDHRRHRRDAVPQDRRTGRERRSGRDRRRLTAVAGNETWFARDAIERAHIIDSVERIRPASAVNSIAILVATAALAPSIGWLPLVPLLVTGAAWTLYTFLLGRLERPEVHAFALVVASIVAFGVAAALGGPDAAAIVLLVNVYLVGAAAGGARGPATALIAVGAVTTVAALLATLRAGTIARDPVALALPLALLIGGGAVGLALGHLARHHRSSGMIDALTAVPNRAALDARADVLEQRALQGDRPVSLLVADLDHFKAVNDEHGHAHGDRVLVEFARRIEAALAGTGTPYRFGGEEFVIVIEPCDAAQARTAAERLRTAVERAPLAGVAATVSVGVSTWRPGEHVACFRTLLARGDAALYAAKQAGRNLVVVADDGAVAGPALAEPAGAPA